MSISVLPQTLTFAGVAQKQLNDILAAIAKDGGNVVDTVSGANISGHGVKASASLDASAGVLTVIVTKAPWYDLTGTSTVASIKAHITAALAPNPA